VMAEDGQEAVDNARRFTSYEPGYCLKFVRAEAWQIGSLYGSAKDAWYGAKKRHPGDRRPPLGAPMFYNGNSHYGHIVVNTGQERIRSTDCQTSGHVSEAELDWPVEEWGQGYLGWTEDLNGVNLPLFGMDEEDEMKPEDWDKLRDIVAQEVGKVWTEAVTVTKPNGQKEEKSAEQVLRETWQRVAKLGAG
jgi:hypothetical protein